MQPANMTDLEKANEQSESPIGLKPDPLAAAGLQVPDLLGGRDFSSVIGGISREIVADDTASKPLTPKQAKALQKTLNNGRKLVEKNRFDQALVHFLEAWDYLPNDLDLLTVIAHCLNHLGVRDKAILVIERALKHHTPTPDIVSVIMNLALNMRIYDVAVKIGNILVSMEPRESRHYVNLATAYSAEERYDESIEMLQQVIPVFPESSDLWNVLATQVRARDGAEESVVFFQEAIRLNPGDFKIYSNLAMSYTQMGKFPKAIEADRKSIELNPHSPEPQLGLAVLLFMIGDLQEAWKYYEARYSPMRDSNQTQIYTHNIPEWQGESLKGKKLFLAAEQGIGDEVMWGNHFRELEKQADQIIIGCEPRLASIYERSYPNAIVSPLADVVTQGYRYRSFPKMQKMMKDGELEIDYSVPLASAPRYNWKTSEDVKYAGQPSLIPDPELVEKFAKRFKKLGDKPKVGLAWRSGILNKKRSYLYCSAKHLDPFMALKDHVEFVNLQYGDCEEELKQMKELYGVDVHQFKDVNLKQDIEANLAIMTNCDLVLSSTSAPGIFAMSCGCPTILMSLYEIWWSFGVGDGSDAVFVKDAKVVHGDTWPEILEKTGKAVREKLNL